ncbi:MAG: OmpA family protein [Candidatus Symbiothrix sp.]|jgi:outer membrane protein OmpA-like peptidoglycan-associated protein|nr:OmpA family protein [Candidatus Symbiothrix sp.]
MKQFSIKYQIFILLLTLLPLQNVRAQEADSITNVWRNNWYIEAGAGTQLLFSSDVSNLHGRHRFTPDFSLSGGKWFSPLWGIRLQMNGYSLNGFTIPTTNSSWSSENGVDPVRDNVFIRPDGSYRHYLHYLNAHVDVRASMFNLFGGFNNYRWDIIPSVGVGYLRTFAYLGTPSTNNASANVSLTGKYAVNKTWDVNLEVFGAAFPNSFDGRTTKAAYEGNAGVTIGVTYNFDTPKAKIAPPSVRNHPFLKPTMAKEAHDDEQIQALDRRGVDEILERLDTIDKKIEAQKLNSIEVPKATKEVERPQKPFTLTAILFNFDSSKKPVEGQEIKYVNVVNYLKTHPEAKIRLLGYGDKKTGTAQSNLKISKKRIETVRQELINTYNIDSQRIEAQALGIESQPYEINEWTRVVGSEVIGKYNATICVETHKLVPIGTGSTH